MRNKYSTTYYYIKRQKSFHTRYCKLNSASLITLSANCALTWSSSFMLAIDKNG